MVPCTLLGQRRNQQGFSLQLGGIFGALREGFVMAPGIPGPTRLRRDLHGHPSGGTPQRIANGLPSFYGVFRPGVVQDDHRIEQDSRLEGPISDASPPTPSMHHPRHILCDQRSPSAWLSTPFRGQGHSEQESPNTPSMMSKSATAMLPSPSMSAGQGFGASSKMHEPSS